MQYKTEKKLLNRGMLNIILENITIITYLLLALYFKYYRVMSFITYPYMQSPVNGSQSPAQSHGRQPYSWKPQYPTMHRSHCNPPTPGLQMQFPLEGSHMEPSVTWKGMEPIGLQVHAEKGQEFQQFLIKIIISVETNDQKLFSGTNKCVFVKHKPTWQ